MTKIIVLSVVLLVSAVGSVRAHEGHSKPRMTKSIEEPSVQPARPAQSELKVMMGHLKQPEYIHVLINVMPLVGMALGAALLLAGLGLKSEGIREGGLALVVLAGVITFPTIAFGQRAYDRLYEQIPLEAQQWLDVHMNRAEKLQWIFYLTAALALWALVNSRMKKPSAVRQAQAAMAAAGLCAALAAWISHAGGQVTHSEFRMGPPMSNVMPTKESHDRMAH